MDEVPFMEEKGETMEEEASEEDHMKVRKKNMNLLIQKEEGKEAKVLSHIFSVIIIILNTVIQ